MLTVQVRLSAETVVHPVQLASIDPAGTVATSVTVLFFTAPPTQVPAFAAQAMSGSVSVEVMVPSRRPVRCSRPDGEIRQTEPNVAVTFFCASIGTVQVPVPVHAPDHPVKLEPVLGAAVSVTVVPTTKLLWHTVPQEIPVGAEVTVPAPASAFVTYSTAAVLRVHRFDEPRGVHRDVARASPGAVAHPAVERPSGRHGGVQRDGRAGRHEPGSPWGRRCRRRSR